MLKSIIVVCAATLSAILLGDVVLWRMAPLPLDDAISVRFEQNLPGLKTEILYSENAYGLRSMSMKTRDKPDNTIRILALGASTTQQLTQGIEDTWSGLLETALNASLGSQRRVEVAAYGRGGDRARDVLDWARKNLRRFDPDIVILLLGINDLALNGGPDYRYSGVQELHMAIGAEQKQNAGFDFKSTLRSICVEYSQICRRLRLLKRRISAPADQGLVVEWHSDNLPQRRREHSRRPVIAAPERVVDPYNEFTDAVDLLLKLINHLGIRVLVLGQPVLWKDSMTNEESSALWFPVGSKDGLVRVRTEWLYREMTRYNDALAKIAARYNASYLDLDKLIDKDLENYFDDCHFTDLGSQNVAAALFPVVLEQINSLARQ